VTSERSRLYRRLCSNDGLPGARAFAHYESSRNEVNCAGVDVGCGESSSETPSDQPLWGETIQDVLDCLDNENRHCPPIPGNGE
jgi:hypothetical protein